MNSNKLTLLIIAATLLQVVPGVALPQQVYKWTDAAGQVHYGQQKPEGATQVQTQTIDIAPQPSAAPGNSDSTAEIARINALSEQMARERQATEQARQEQAIRDLEQQNQQLQNDLLKQQQQQPQPQPQSGNNDGIFYGSSPYYPPPYSNSYPPRPPDHGPPCRPWPECHRPIPPEPPPPKPRPSVKPSEVPETVPGGFFRGR